MAAKKLGYGALILFSIIIVSLIGFAAANSTSSFSTGFKIQSPEINTLPVNSNYTFHINLFNMSTGNILWDPAYTCEVLITNQTGDYVADVANINFTNTDFSASINNAFNSIGIYNYQINCVNLVTNEGGFVTGSILVTPTLNTTNGVAVTIYIFFLLLCLALISGSFYLMLEHPMDKDQLKETEEQEENKLYETKKRNEISFYIELIKKKMWIIGAFGFYIFGFIFLALLNQLVFDAGIVELNTILAQVVYILAWGFIPFIIFWIGYVIIYFYMSTIKIMKHEFGGFRN